MGNPFKAIGRFFKMLGKGIAKGFSALFGSEAAKKFAEGAAALLATQLGKIALSAVEAVESLALGTPDEKRAEAFRRIREQAAASGLEVRNSLVNMLIEVAVQAIRNRVAAEE